MSYVKVWLENHASGHDKSCPILRDEDPKVIHYRVTRPLAYNSNTPGYKCPAGRQGYYTNACCPVRAAGLITERLAKDNMTQFMSELDVQEWI